MNFPRLAAVSLKDRLTVGGKAANLGELFSIGVNVPNGFVVPVHYSDSFLAAAGRETRSVPRTAYSATIPAGELSGADGVEFEHEVSRAFRQLGVESAAVRSSATVEDASQWSFAGLFDSFLNVRENELVDAIKSCWLSARSSRVRDYSAANNVPIEAVKIAVIVQGLVTPDVSGVCFTANPTTNDRDEMLIEAVWGFGDALVGGRLAPDSYVYHWPSRKLLQAKVATQVSARLLADGGLKEMPIHMERSRRQKLDSELIDRVAAVCRSVERHYARPQDIEFAVHHGTIYVLQSRPITTIH